MNGKNKTQKFVATTSTFLPFISPSQSPELPAVRSFVKANSETVSQLHHSLSHAETSTIIRTRPTLANKRKHAWRSPKQSVVKPSQHVTKQEEDKNEIGSPPADQAAVAESSTLNEYADLVSNLAPLNQSDLSETDNFVESQCTNTALPAEDVTVEDLETDAFVESRVFTEDSASREAANGERVSPSLGDSIVSVSSKIMDSDTRHNSVTDSFSGVSHADSMSDSDIPADIESSDFFNEEVQAIEECIEVYHRKIRVQSCKVREYLATFEALLEEEDSPPVKRTGHQRSKSAPDVFVRIQQLFKPLKRKSICLAMLQQQYNDVQVNFADELNRTESPSESEVKSSAVDVKSDTAGLPHLVENEVAAEVHEMECIAESGMDPIAVADVQENSDITGLQRAFESLLLDPSEIYDQYYTVSDRLLLKDGYYNIDEQSQDEIDSKPEPLPCAIPVENELISPNFSTSHQINMELNILPQKPSAVKQKLKLLRPRKQKLPIIPVELHIDSPPSAKRGGTWRRKLKCLKQKPKSRERFRQVPKTIVKPRISINKKTKPTFRTKNSSYSERIVARKAERLRKRSQFMQARRADYSHVKSRVKTTWDAEPIRRKGKQSRSKMPEIQVYADFEYADFEWYEGFCDRFNTLERDLEQCDTYDIEKSIEELKLTVDLQFPPWKCTSH